MQLSYPNYSLLRNVQFPVEYLWTQQPFVLVLLLALTEGEIPQHLIHIHICGNHHRQPDFCSN